MFPTICAVAGRCRQRHSDSDAFWGGRRRAPRRKQGMLIPLMVALIPKLFCSQRLADYVELRETSACPPINYNFPGFAEMLILLHFQWFLHVCPESVPGIGVRDVGYKANSLYEERSIFVARARNPGSRILRFYLLRLYYVYSVCHS